MKIHPHLEHRLQERRAYLELAWIQRIVENPLQREVQDDGRIRLWGYVQELDKYVRVVLLKDGETVLTAFSDRDFSPDEP